MLDLPGGRIVNMDNAIHSGRDEPPVRSQSDGILLIQPQQLFAGGEVPDDDLTGDSQLTGVGGTQNVNLDGAHGKSLAVREEGEAGDGPPVAGQDERDAEAPGVPNEDLASLAQAELVTGACCQTLAVGSEGDAVDLPTGTEVEKSLAAAVQTVIPLPATQVRRASGEQLLRLADIVGRPRLKGEGDVREVLAQASLAQGVLGALALSLFVLAGDLLGREGLLGGAFGAVSFQPLPCHQAKAERRGQEGNRRERRHRRATPGPLPQSLCRSSRAGADRLAIEEAAQIVGQLLCRGVALVRFLLETFQTDRFQVARHSWLQAGRRDRLLDANLLQRVNDRGAAERRSPAEHLVEDRAERVHVHRWPDMVSVPARLFGCHVAGCAQDGAAACLR